MDFNMFIQHLHSKLDNIFTKHSTAVSAQLMLMW